MDAIILLIKFVLLLFATFAGYTIGWFFTEKYDLASKSSLFRFKAFECRPCLTFHSIWVTSTIFSILFLDWVMFVCGILFAAITYLGLKIDEKEKTIKL